MHSRNTKFCRILFALALCCCVLFSGGCGGSSSSPSVGSNNEESAPVVSGTFRITAGRFDDGTANGSFKSSSPETFTFILRQNADSETYSAVLSGDAVQNSGNPESYIDCTFTRSGGGEDITARLTAGGNDYVYTLDEGEVYYVSGNYEGTHKEIAVYDNGSVGYKYSIALDSGEFRDEVEVNLEPVN